MPKMSMCTCEIAHGGDLRQIRVVGLTYPISWPEVQVQQHYHGRSAVTNIKVVSVVETTVAEEMQRLLQKHRRNVITTMFPGSNPMIELEVPGAPAPLPVHEGPPAPVVETPAHVGPPAEPAPLTENMIPAADPTPAADPDYAAPADEEDNDLFGDGPTKE